MVTSFRGVFKHRQTSKTERFTKIVNDLKPLPIFAKRSILDIWQDSAFAIPDRLSSLFQKML